MLANADEQQQGAYFSFFGQDYGGPKSDTSNDSRKIIRNRSTKCFIWGTT